MITSINKVSYPGTLIVILGQDDGQPKYEERADITRITDSKGIVTGFNFFNIESVIDYDQLPNGQVKLSADDLAALNAKLAEVGFNDKLAYGQPTVVYGLVKSCEAHLDSDHLHVTKVDVGAADDVQIVCGAPNIAAGQTVVVALSGTLMPNGLEIWPGELRGVASFGMICAARELGLPHAPEKRGIMVVPDSFKAGAAFEPTKCDELIASGVITL